MRARTLALASVVLGSLVACQDSPTRPTGPSQATFTLTVGERDWWPSDNPEKEYWLTADLTRETAGLGGNIDFLRLEGKGPGGTYEKAEIGSDLVVAGLGTNRVNASSTWSYTVGWEWNMQNALGYKITVQITDDRRTPVGTGKLTAHATVRNLQNHPDDFCLDGFVLGLPIGCQVTTFPSSTCGTIRRLGKQTHSLSWAITCAGSVPSGSYPLTLGADVFHFGCCELDESNNSATTTANLRIR